MAKRPILAVLIAGLGDTVLARDGLAALKKGWAEREVHLLTNAQSAPLAQSMDMADKILGFPIRDLRSPSVTAFRRILSAIRTVRLNEYRMAANLYQTATVAGRMRMRLLFATIRAEQRIVDPGPFGSRHAAQAITENAIRAGGAPAGQLPSLYPAKSPLLTEALASLSSSGPVIGINPGADMPGKLWPPKRFAAVADTLHRACDARVIILGGPGEEPAALAVATAMYAPSASVSGRIPTAELPALTAGLDLMVTADSGPMHVAAATGTPVAALFGQGDPRTFGPILPPDKLRLFTADVPCRPCGKRHCRTPECLTAIPAATVAEGCLQLLGHNGKKGGNAVC